MKCRFDPLRIRREGHGRPAPGDGIGRFFYLLWAHGWKLVGVNLLFIACSLPVVTMPAALCALNRVLIKLVRDGNVLLWEEFRDEFKGDFLHSLPIGLLFGALLFLGYFLLSLAMSNLNSIYGLLCMAFGLLVTVFSLARAIYAFLMRAMFALRNRDILKNAHIMAAARGGRGLIAVAILLVGYVLAFLFFPYSLIVVLVCGFSLTHYAICYLLNDPIEEHIISPWEQMQMEAQTLNQGGNPE